MARRRRCLELCQRGRLRLALRGQFLNMKQRIDAFFLGRCALATQRIGTGLQRLQLLWITHTAAHQLCIRRLDALHKALHGQVCIGLLAVPAVQRGVGLYQRSACGHDFGRLCQQLLQLQQPPAHLLPVGINRLQIVEARDICHVVASLFAARSAAGDGEPLALLRISRYAENRSTA